ncbi:MAG: flagella basal body P-ring formation protein FlgA [Proteobacteria bacterium]|nr:flagella basal body P-ring formation protein FlgA [Pseudomonadota bacterium]
MLSASPKHWALVLATAAALLLGARPASAQLHDRVLLEELIPVLAGSELGRLELGPAPLPGATRVVRRQEVLAALRAAGRTSEGLQIPRARRVTRAAQRLSPSEVRALLRPALARALSPCKVDSIQVHTPLTLSAGPVTVRTTARAPRRSGRLGAAFTLSSGGRDKQMVAPVSVTCPEPTIASGRALRIVAVVGNVRASISGFAKQDGRVGDLIHVVTTSHKSLRARVLDSSTVQVLQ